MSRPSPLDVSDDHAAHRRDVGIIGPRRLQTSLGTGNSIQVSSTMLTAVGAALQAVTSYSTLIGATQDRMTAAATLNSALTTNYANGVSATRT
jgi:flagellin-like hook-associated protein FlgL